ncbi:MAG: ATP synthase F1 subunit gamma [Holosporaceae bacterium]|jgi:F-type H+-transporting ATPase subunit gamma|nr:ATP synthase F1 subunit gamma [Holosporaceae bacterium]
MTNLKELRNKVSVVQSTRKVTMAMKLVAGVKLKKAEQKAVASREYAQELDHILSLIRRELIDVNYELFSGRSLIHTEMLVVFASDKGLCGNFNYLIGKEVFRIISEIHAENKKIHVVCVGSKLFNIIKQKLLRNDIIELAEDFYRSDKLFFNAQKLADKVIADFTTNGVDRVSVVRTKYRSVTQCKVETKSIIPLLRELNSDRSETIFEPNVEEVLKMAIPHNIAIQIYQSALESVASEHGARMTSMDNATRNADELLSELTTTYNRIRQYNITQELVEVVSGAAAVARG